MNYIKAINAFHNRLETNPLSAAAANLWHVLMHVNNRAGWQRKFTVSISLLCCKASLSESSFKRARIELVEKGYIHYRSQNGSKAAVYEIVSLVSEIDPKCYDDPQTKQDRQDVMPARENTMVSENLDGNVDDNPNGNPSALYKQNKTKQINTYSPTTIDTEGEVCCFYQQNFGMLNNYIANELKNWTESTGENLVIHAMKKSLERGKTSWGYVKGVLKSWEKKGISSLEAANLEEVNFKNNKQRRRGLSISSVHKHADVIPEWYHDNKREHQRKRNAQKNIYLNPKKQLEQLERRLQAIRDEEKKMQKVSNLQNTV